MLEENNILEKRELVVSYFLEYPNSTLQEISNATGISSSSCQRYLNLPEYCGLIISKTGNTISDQLKINKALGNKQGGRTTFKRYKAQKDEAGKFIGFINNEFCIDAENKKRDDIVKIVTYFSKNPYVTLTEIENFFGELYTSDYIYDCLNDSRVKEIFGNIISSAITEQLSRNNYSILKKYNGLWDKDIFVNAGLTEHEIEILMYRYTKEGDIHSAEATGIQFGISKSAVTKTENIAIKKLKKYEESLKRK